MPIPFPWPCRPKSPMPFLSTLSSSNIVNLKIQVIFCRPKAQFLCRPLKFRPKHVPQKNRCGNVIELQYVKLQLSSFTCKFVSICLLLVATMMIANIIQWQNKCSVMQKMIFFGKQVSNFNF